MKSFKKIIVVVIILALLTVAYLLVKDKKGEDTNNNNNTTTVSDVTDLMKIEQSDVKTFSVRNDSGKFTFVKSGSTWVFSNKKDLDLDDVAVNSMITQIIDISSTKTVTDNAADVSQYGFDNPMLLQVVLKDGTVKQLEIGKRNSSNKSNYARYPNSKKIYLIDYYVYNIFVFTEKSLRDATIFTIEMGDITGYTLTKKSKIVYRIERDEASNWIIEYPDYANADQTVLSGIFETMLVLKKINYIESDAKNLSKYGLDNPSYVIEIKHKSGTITITLGDVKVNGSEIYAKLNGSNDVFTLDIANLNFIDKPLGEMMDSFIYNVPIGDVSNIKVVMDGHTVDFDIVSDGTNFNKDIFTVNGKDATKKDSNGKQIARYYYQALIGLERIDKVDTDVTPSGKVAVTITYTMEIEPYTMKIEFISKNSKYYYIIKNGIYSGLMMKKSAFDVDDGVREMYTKLMKLIN